jgi:hypothetical protein
VGGALKSFCVFATILSLDCLWGNRRISNSLGVFRGVSFMLVLTALMEDSKKVLIYRKSLKTSKIGRKGMHFCKTGF